MKLENILCLIFLAFLFTKCKKDSTSTGDEVYKNQYEAMAILNQLGQLVEQHNNAGHPVGDALVRSMNDISQEPSVKEVWHLDSMYVFITMTSGMKARFSLLPLDSAGNAQFRGSGSGGGGVFKQLSSAFSGTCTEITNKTVLVYHPYDGLFSAVQLGWDEKLEEYKNEGIIDDYKIVLHEACNYNVVKTFKDYGLVMVSTHGYPDGFSFQMIGRQPELGDEFIPEKEMVAILQQTQDKQVTDQIRLGLIYIELRKAYTPSAGMQQNWEVGEKPHWGLATSSPLIAQWDLSNTIVVGLHCYSGYESNLGLEANVIPIAEAYRSAGTRTYYGFQFLSGLSQVVDDNEARRAEIAIYTNFFEDEDSTGRAHLDEFYDEIFDERLHRQWPHKPKNYFRLVNGSEGYCFKSCGEEFTDPRDGQKYKTTCIGDQVWMAENLNYSAGGTIGLCYDNNSANCGVYGRLYSIAELTGKQASSPGIKVKGICPQGWHVPSQDEVQELLDFVGGSGVAGSKLKADTLWAAAFDDEYNFSLLPGGQAGVNNTTGGAPSFSNILARFWGWTSSVYIPTSGDNDYIGYYTTNNDPHISFFGVGDVTSTAYYSCRCVKD